MDGPNVSTGPVFITPSAGLDYNAAFWMGNCL